MKRCNLSENEDTGRLWVQFLSMQHSRGKSLGQAEVSGCNGNTVLENFASRETGLADHISGFSRPKFHKNKFCSGAFFRAFWTRPIEDVKHQQGRLFVTGWNSLLEGNMTS